MITSKNQRVWAWIRNNIHRLTALVMIGLGLNALRGASLVVEELLAWGIPNDVVGGVLLGGAILTLITNTPLGFIFGTLPYAIYVIMTVVVTTRHGAGYPTSIIYLFSYLQLLALYDREEHCGK